MAGANRILRVSSRRWEIPSARFAQTQKWEMQAYLSKVGAAETMYRKTGWELEPGMNVADVADMMYNNAVALIEGARRSIHG